MANGLNQYPKVDTKTFTYRTDGPMTYDGVRYFAYDERRNLTLARQGALTAGNYEQDLYDALGARWYSARAATTIADTRRVELTDGLRPEVAVEEMINIPEGTTDQDAAGGRFSVMGTNPDERLIWIDATAAALQVRYVHASRRGDARILSRGGAPERKYTYSAFGESTDNVTGYPWRFTGQRFNSWTGLYHFKARAYSPALGRFMQPDPIGYDDGPNIYAYVKNDAMNAVDPTGLQCLTCEKGNIRENGEVGDYFNASAYLKSSIQDNYEGCGLRCGERYTTTYQFMELNAVPGAGGGTKLGAYEVWDSWEGRVVEAGDFVGVKLVLGVEFSLEGGVEAVIGKPKDGAKIQLDVSVGPLSLTIDRDGASPNLVYKGGFNATAIASGTLGYVKINHEPRYVDYAKGEGEGRRKKP
ncbi:RHS repeat-associated core domain-containing protein [Caulobacter sp. NIBR1757]|uniref:RHS repeat-associated core domain-containing protein n=1 Tax=Caulobacter sp. NIBR1757 TaxID=3016000 RepID=UPI0022F0AD83|nr:RHS repeat-associated core domain-containing protein [Caulobacter sp. NIBR1757]